MSKGRKRGPTKAEKKQRKTGGQDKQNTSAQAPALSATDKLVANVIKALLSENGGSADLKSVCRYLPGGRPAVERFGLFKVVDGDGGNATVQMLEAGREPVQAKPSRDGASDDGSASDDGGADRKRKAKRKRAEGPDDAGHGVRHDGPNIVSEAELLERVTKMVDRGGGRAVLGEVLLEFPSWSRKALKKLKVFEFCDQYLLLHDDQTDRILATFSDAMQAGAAKLESDGQRDDAHADGANGVRFEDVPLLQETKLALEKAFKLERMTAIQESTLLPILRGHDVLARAKTGSGKTLAFLVPLVELLRNQAFRSPRKIHTLVVVPTRELAIQVADEAKKLGSFFVKQAPTVLLLSMQGGAQASIKIGAKKNWKFDFVVGTPGRLCGMIKGSETFQDQLKALRFLVFDEADQLLARSFQDELGLIVAALPVKRQTLLFSATFDKTVMQAAKESLRPDHEVVDVIGAGGLEAPEQILHSYAVTSMKRITRDLWQMLHHQIAKAEDFKIIVFFQTIRVAQFFASLFRNSKLSRYIMEMHSKMDTKVRTEVTRKFRSAAKRILFSSDVSSRGMDYPDVTCVMQVGIPQSRQIYLHRLGRTGRAGKAGENILLLFKHELPFLKRVQDIPITEAEVPNLEMEEPPGPSVIPDSALKRRVYASWIGYMCYQKVLEVSHEEIVRRANRYAEAVLGCLEPPALLRAPLEKMGLPEDTPGLNVRAFLAPGEDRGTPYFVEGVNLTRLGAPDIIDWNRRHASDANTEPIGERGTTPFGMDLGKVEDASSANVAPLGERKHDSSVPQDEAIPPAKRKRNRNRNKRTDAAPAEEALGKQKAKSDALLPVANDQAEAVPPAKRQRKPDAAPAEKAAEQEIEAPRKRKSKSDLPLADEQAEEIPAAKRKLHAAPAEKAVEQAEAIPAAKRKPDAAPAEKAAEQALEAAEQGSDSPRRGRYEEELICPADSPARRKQERQLHRAQVDEPDASSSEWGF